MKIEPKVLKGFRDFLPENARKRQFVIKTLQSVFELYGFEPLETPTLEYEEILTGKYGEEGEKLMYRFEDHGKRRVAMRYDQTVPLARVIAQYQNEITLPFKRYQIQPVWRADNTQRGRFREFLQCDIDTIGSQGPLSDAEILQTVEKAYEALGFKDFIILINDRKNFEGVDPKAIAIIDKLKKIGEEGVKKELQEKGFESTLLQEIQDKPETESLKQILSLAASNRIQYEPTLARGLDYYTGIIIEVEINGYTVGSVGGGGRYDRLIGMFAKNDYPAVGYAFGFDRTIEAMEELNLFPAQLIATKVLITVFSPELKQKSLEIGALLRENNINTEIYLDETAKMDKQLKYADKKKIPYVVVIGPDEAKQNNVVLKNMKTREQETIEVSVVKNKLS
jgi:histidyl-tRNA synthetase